MNLGQIVARCADMMARTDLGTQIREEVTLAVKRYERELWFFSETRGATITCVASQTWYDSASVPGVGAVALSRLLSIDYMRITSHLGGLDDEMRETPYALFEAWQEGSPSAGQPTNFTRYNAQIGVWPTPTGADVLYFSGKFKPVVPVNDADTSVFFTEAQELIESCAVANVYEKFLRDLEAAAPHRQREAIQIAALRGEGVNKMGTGRLRANY